MLNLESLSIKRAEIRKSNDEPIFKLPETKAEYKKEIDRNHNIDKAIDKKITLVKKFDMKVEKPMKESEKKTDFVPKVMQLPNNWNLETIELRLEMKAGVKDLISPDDHLDSEWEVI